MGFSSFGVGRALVVRLVWLWVLLGLLLLVGSASVLLTRHGDHKQRTADTLEQVKNQMEMQTKDDVVEEKDKFEFSEIKIDYEKYIADENMNNLENIDNVNINSIEVNHENINISTNNLNMIKEKDNNDDQTKKEYPAEYIYDADFEEEIQEEIKSVEKQEIKKDDKVKSKKGNHKKYKMKINNYDIEQGKMSIGSQEEDLTGICNSFPCPATPPDLRGVLEFPDKFVELQSSVSYHVRKGGSWWPSECQPRYRVAVLVPYSQADKEQILPFLQHMHVFLQKQQLNYTIFFIKQQGDAPLNHGKLLNVGYRESQTVGPWDCWVFHDLNLIPLDDRHLYHCDPLPRHLSVRTQHIKLFPVNELEFYKAGFAGATMLTQDHMEATNGWSNKFWDSEEDLGRNMKYRLMWQDLQIWRYPPTIANYFMVGEKVKSSWIDGLAQHLWMKYMGVKTSDFTNDGLSSLKYKVLDVTQEPLYTNIIVDIGSKVEDTKKLMKH